MVRDQTWQQVKEILAEVLEAEPEHRGDRLKNATLDAEVRAEVESLLACEADAEALMALPAVTYSGIALEERLADSFPGSAIGPFRVIRELGSGGMGVVYLAERADGKFEQKVALKLLRRELTGTSLRQRFDQERKILASLEHPNIARLLNSGSTEDGVPFLAMEYVDGQPIDVFCIEKDLSLTVRLKLFNKVCEAVSYAHQNLIVHRDLKPSNIVVTPEGIPKLLDFGIAKLIDLSVSETEGVTGGGILTPDYASPEQITGGHVSTAADIYSLGVILFKLLTGRHPFDLENKLNGSKLTAILNSEPALASNAAKLAKTGIIKPSQLVGDLDNIILKALRKTPDERYRTVEQFSEDIWNYLDGKPVSARKATFSYRLSKFYQRNKLATIAGSIALSCICAGGGAAMWQADKAYASRGAAVAEMERAKAEEEKANKISRFMMKIVRYANPRWYAEGYRFRGEARVIDALDDMASKIDTEFADQPDVLAELHHHFGDAYMTRNEPGGREKANAHFLRAFELRRGYYGDWHELLAKDMAYLYWVQTPPRSEDFVKMMSDAIVMMRATNPKNLNLPFMLEDYFHRLSDDDRSAIHDIYLQYVPQPAPNDKYLAADQLFDEMLGLLRLHFPEDSPQILNQKCNGLNPKFKANKLSEGEQFYQECKVGIERLKAEDQPVPPSMIKSIEDYERNTGKVSRSSQ